MQNAVAQHKAENRANTASRVAGSAAVVVSEGHTSTTKKNSTPKMSVITDNSGCVVKGIRSWADIRAANLAMGLG